MQRVAILCYIDPQDGGPNEVGPVILYCDIIDITLALGKVISVDTLDIKDARVIRYFKQFRGQEIDVERGFILLCGSRHPPPRPHEIRYMAFLPQPKPKQ